jgi:ribosomal protein L18E
VESRITVLEDNIHALEHSDNKKEKIRKYGQNILDLQNTIKKPNLWA